MSTFSSGVGQVWHGTFLNFATWIHPKCHFITTKMKIKVTLEIRIVSCSKFWMTSEIKYVHRLHISTYHKIWFVSAEGAAAQVGSLLAFSLAPISYTCSSSKISIDNNVLTNEFFKIIRLIILLMNMHLLCLKTFLEIVHEDVHDKQKAWSHPSSIPNLSPFKRTDSKQIWHLFLCT